MQRRKLTRKEKAELQKPVSEAKVQHARVVSSQGRLILYLSLIVAAVGFLLYINTLNHEYVLDDYSVIKENRLTRQGWDAFPEVFKTSYRFGYYFVNDELYRPVVKSMFAAEWGMWPDSPSPSHWINVLLYAFTGFMLMYVFARYFKGNLLIPFIISLLFMAHPIHTEVVANIKSRDEILSLFFILFSFLFISKYLERNKIFNLLIAGIFYLLSLLSKESGITFLAVFPLALYFLSNATTSQNIKTTLWMVGAVAVFLAMRNNVLENNLKETFSVADNLLTAAKEPGQKFATAVMILGMYLKLLVFPHPLVFDYSFNQIPIINVTDWRFIVSLIIYVSMAVLAVIRLKKKELLVFGILYFLITLSIFSNIIVTIGTSFGERLMFLPSLGFCIAIAAILIRYFSKGDTTRSDSLPQFFRNNLTVIGITACVVILYSFKTVTRNATWKNNMTLFSNDVNLSPNSTRTHYYLGNYMTKPENIGVDPKDTVRMYRVLDSAIVELNKAIDIYPKFCDVYKQMGVAYGKKKDLKSSFDYYNKAIECNPTDAPSHSNIGTVLFEQGNAAEALKAFQKAVSLDPNYTEALANLGATYGMLQQYANSIDALHRCIKTDPGYAQAYYFLSLSYGNKGDKQNADFYMQKYKELGGNR